MERLLPLFPLNLVTFPDETVNLHIFEPRYRQLVNDCLEKDAMFGIPVHQEGVKMTLGTSLKIISISKTYADGKLDITTKAMQPFRLNIYYDNYPSKLYPGGEVSYFDWYGQSDLLASKKIIELASRLYKIMNITNVKLVNREDFKCYQIAHKVGFNIEQELYFLTIEKEEDRQAYLIKHLERFLPAVEEMESLRKKAEMNGHFKHVISPDI